MAWIEILTAALISLVTSLVVSVGVSWVFYSLTAKDLRREARRLRAETLKVRHYVNALLTYLESAGWITVMRDAAGDPIEIQIVRVPGHPSDEAVGIPTTTQHPTEEPEGPQESEGEPPG